MPNQPFEAERPVLQHKKQLEKTTQQTEAYKKLQKSGIASVTFSKPEPSRVHGTD